MQQALRGQAGLYVAYQDNLTEDSENKEAKIMAKSVLWKASKCKTAIIHISKPDKEEFIQAIKLQGRL